MEFFNRKEEVLDVELTQYGKYLLSVGKFKPSFYAFFDDDVIYDTQYQGPPPNADGTALVDEYGKSLRGPTENQKDSQKRLKVLMAQAIEREPSLKTNLQVQEAGAPIDINVDKEKAFANLNKASAEFVQKRIDESDLENIAQQDDTTMGKIGARTKMTIGDPEWWLNLSLNQPWKKTAGMKRFESMNQLKKEAPTLYYKMLLSEGVDPNRNMNIPVRLQFEMENPEFGTPLSSQIKSTSYFDGGIASLRRKK